MSLQNTLQLIEEVKLKHLAMGAAGLAGAGYLGFQAADAGLLGHDAEVNATALKTGAGAVKQGFNLGQDKYDITTDPNHTSIIDRNIEGLKGAKAAAKLGYNVIKANYDKTNSMNF
jgi:hypothetical protein